MLEHALLIGKRGSEAHGTYVPPESGTHGTDDRDIMAICVPPLPYFFGTKRWDGAEGIRDVWDVVAYPLGKFVQLLLKQNPNVVCMLWLREQDYLHVTPGGRRLIEHRDIFRSKRAFGSFCGYANGQLQRMTHVEDGQSKKGLHRYATGFLGAKRKALVERYGYDVKNAAHLVRLLKMGIEFLRDGVLNVNRSADAAELIEIKTGGWPLEKVQAYAERLFADFRAAHEASALPEEPDAEAADALCVEIVLDFFAGSVSG